MRGIAILPIVLTHCYDTFNWQGNAFADFFMPLSASINLMFIFMAGYLFEHLSRPFEYKKYLGKKIRNVICPYLFVSIPAILLYLSGLKTNAKLSEVFFSKPLWEQVLYFIVTGAHLGPLWFIPMMVLFYLAAPLLLKVNENPRLYWLIIPLFVFAEWVGRPVHDLFPPQAFLHYLPVYLMGMAFSCKSEEIIPLLTRYTAPLCCLGLLAAGLSVLLPYLGGVAPHLSLKAVICVAVFALVSRYMAQSKNNVLDLFARYSFGIFFIHGYVVAAGRRMAGTYPQYFRGSWWEYGVYVLLVLALCLLTVKMGKIILRDKSRMVLGA